MESSLDEATLQANAERAAGQFFRARDSEQLKNIYEEIDRLEDRGELSYRTEYEDAWLCPSAPRLSCSSSSSYWPRRYPRPALEIFQLPVASCIFPIESLSFGQKAIMSFGCVSRRDRVSSQSRPQSLAVSSTGLLPDTPI